MGSAGSCHTVQRRLRPSPDLDEHKRALLIPERIAANAPLWFLYGAFWPTVSTYRRSGVSPNLRSTAADARTGLKSDATPERVTRTREAASGEIDAIASEVALLITARRAAFRKAL